MRHPIVIESPADIDPAIQRLQTRKKEVEARRLDLEQIVGQVNPDDPVTKRKAVEQYLLKRAEWEAADFVEMEKALQEQIDGLLRMKFGPMIARH